MFQKWFKECEMEGYSSHSVRKSFISRCAERITEAEGSLKDVQLLAGHKSLQSTQKYVKGSLDSQKKVIDLI